jgi:hypothetical protein
VVRDEHADSPFLQEPDDLLDVEHGDRIDAGERLVQQDEARVRRESARDSTRRRSPPDSAIAGLARRWPMCRSSRSPSRRPFDLLALHALQLQHRLDVLRDGELA